MRGDGKVVEVVAPAPYDIVTVREFEAYGLGFRYKEKGGDAILNDGLVYDTRDHFLCPLENLDGENVRKDNVAVSGDVVTNGSNAYRGNEVYHDNLAGQEVGNFCLPRRLPYEGIIRARVTLRPQKLDQGCEWPHTLAFPCTTRIVFISRRYRVSEVAAVLRLDLAPHPCELPP
jgi:hypothetical protein